MRAFLRVVALLVASGNSYVVFMAAAVQDEQEGMKLTEVSLQPAALVFASAFFMGALLAAEILHRYMRGWLEANAFIRYLALVVGVTLGGLLAGLVLSIELVMLSGPLQGISQYDASKDDLMEAASIALWAVLGGGTIGLLEGLFLALPLAAILGLLNSRVRS